MTYLTQTRISADPHIILRVAACATGVGVPDARFWAQENVMRLAVTPGWVDAYRGSSLDDPGADESAITDQMILTAVTELCDAQKPPPGPGPEDTEDPA